MKAIPEGSELAAVLDKFDKRAVPAVQDGKILKLSATLTEQWPLAPDEAGNQKLTIPIHLITLNQEIRTPDQAFMAAHALRGLADLLDEQRGAKVDP